MATKKQIKAGAVGLVLSAMAIAVPFIVTREGDKLVAYQDVGKVWTICSGETHDVQPGQKMTKEQCAALTQSRVGQFMHNVAVEIKVPITADLLSAHTSFAYNIGITGYKRSQTLKLTNKGDLLGGCAAMMNWYTAGGRDCRVKANNCYGLVQRRMDETALCLNGAE